MHSAVNETLNSLDRTRRPVIGITAVVTQIKFAIFEASGDISIIPYPPDHPPAADGLLRPAQNR